MIRNLKGTVDDKITVRTVLVSVTKKDGLDYFIPGLLDINPELFILSTGGTYKHIEKLLGESHKDNLLSVEKYTNFPEMDGGLVKTLHPKIHAGILGERNNPLHRAYLHDQLRLGVFIDMVVVNLYSFEEMIAKIAKGEIDPATEKPYNFESARGNIDVGGPTMLRAAAKNYPGCASICTPDNYTKTLEQLRKNDGATTFEQRLRLAPGIFKLSGSYDTTIGNFMQEQIDLDVEAIKALYTFSEKE